MKIGNGGKQMSDEEILDEKGKFASFVQKPGVSDQG